MRAPDPTEKANPRECTFSSASSRPHPFRPRAPEGWVLCSAPTGSVCLGRAVHNASPIRVVERVAGDRGRVLLQMDGASGRAPRQDAEAWALTRSDGGSESKERILLVLFPVLRVNVPRRAALVLENVKHIREDRLLAAKIARHGGPEIGSYRRAARRRGRPPFHGPLAGARPCALRLLRFSLLCSFPFRLLISSWSTK